MIWDDFLKGKLTLCVTNEIVEEYLEILSQKTTSEIASNVVSVILSQSNVEFVTPYYKMVQEWKLYDKAPTLCAGT